MPAHGIVAQPSTLTGSIGIYGGKFVSGGVYQKLGSSIEVTSIGKHAEMNSPVRPYNADERRKVQEQLQAFYDQFVEKAAQSRRRTPEQIDQVAQGRVWTGQQAQARGLVDALGGLDGAIAMAKERAGIAADRQVEIVAYPAKRTLYEMVSEEFTGAAEQVGIRSWLPATLSPAELAALRALRGYLGPFRRGEALALLPLAYLR
jgi:protease-4